METISITIATMKNTVAKLAGIKTLSFLSFIGGVAVTLGFSNLLFNQKIVLADLSALGRGRHPARHAAPAGPGMLRVLGIAVFDGNSASLTLAAAVHQLAQIEAVLQGHGAHLIAQ